MTAYDVKRKRMVVVERFDGDAIVAYSIPGAPGVWYFPLIVGGKNAEPFVIERGEGGRDGG